MSITKHIPNTLTSLNIVSGCISIVMTFQGNLEMAFAFILIAAGFDFLDGFAARLFKAYSEIGKQLDSLADVISFGAAPAMIVYMIMHLNFSYYYLPFLAFILVIFSALRLAIFNIDDSQTEYFRGLPTPANALFFGSFALLLNTNFDRFLNSEVFIIGSILLFSMLMVSDITMFSLKIKSLKWSDNVLRYIFIVLAIGIIILFKFISIPFLILLYIFLSIVNNLFLKL